MPEVSTTPSAVAATPDSQWTVDEPSRATSTSGEDRTVAVPPVTSVEPSDLLPPPDPLGARDEAPNSSADPGADSPRYRGLRVAAGIGLLLTLVLTVDIFTCAFGRSIVYGDFASCDVDIASFWMAAFAPGVIFIVLFVKTKWLDIGGIRKAILALLAITGIALAAWALDFFDASYRCAGTISGRPFPESPSAYCAVEWSRIAAYAVMLLLFVLCLAYIVLADRRSDADR